jgi:YidC/Oxa1 family membrane protein insertase
MIQLLREIIYRPLFNGLVLLYEHVTFEDLGLAIILLTLIIRFIFYPLFYKTFKHQAAIQKIQPEVKRIQKTHKGNREEQAKQLMGLYRAHNVNPFSSFLLLIVQLPILIALYRLFLNGFTPESFTDLYAFISEPTHINSTFLGLIDLSSSNILIVVFAGIAQYFQAKLSLAKAPAPGKDASPQERIGRQMVVVAPLFTVIILYTLPAAIGLYWLTTSAFSIVQQRLAQRSVGADTQPNDHGTVPSTHNKTS